MRGNGMDIVGVRQLLTRMNSCAMGEPVNISVVDDRTNVQVFFASVINDDVLAHPAMKMKVSGIKPMGYNSIQIFAHN